MGGCQRGRTPKSTLIVGFFIHCLNIVREKPEKFDGIEGFRGRRKKIPDAGAKSDAGMGLGEKARRGRGF